MSDEAEIMDSIREFAAAHAAAVPNAGLMCHNPSAQVVEECAARMKRVGEANEAIFALAGNQGLPENLVSFLAANADKGCNSCWLSSSRGRNHADCNVKIHRWFFARDALIEYGTALITAASTESK